MEAREQAGPGSLEALMAPGVACNPAGWLPCSLIKVSFENALGPRTSSAK